MTTICYKFPILAADTQLTVDDTKLESDDKIVILDPNTVVAFAGYTSSINKLVAFFRQSDWEGKLAKNEIPEIKKDVEGLLLYRGIMYLIDNDVSPMRLYHPFYAIGSGWKFGMAALHMGLSPVDAVKFAGDFDIYTNQRVRYLNVEDFIRDSKTRTRKGNNSRRKISVAGTTQVETAEERRESAD